MEAGNLDQASTCNFELLVLTPRSRESLSLNSETDSNFKAYPETPWNRLNPMTLRHNVGT